jgi:hypothetical protein
LQAVLSVGDLGIVAAYQARTLRDEDIPAAGRIVDVLANQRPDFARKVGVDALFEHAGISQPGDLKLR